MSKEKTPITEEELYISIADILGRHWGIDVENTKKCVEIAEQYAQAKVLEALEREVVKFSKHAFKEAKAAVIWSNDSAVIWSNDYPLHVAKNYIETEVKPKYE